jgi:hypothetical protein
MSRQFEHLQEASLKRLQAMVPHDCSLVVRRRAPGTSIGGSSLGGFVVEDAHGDGYSGRFQVVAAWIEGYVRAWSWQK